MALAFPKPNVAFHVFIDEGGDFGIKPLNPIASHHGSKWFVLGAIAVSSENVVNIDRWCEEIKQACGVLPGRPLHYRLLSEDKRLLACRMISQLPVRCFVFCTLKSNMRGYRNERAEAATNDKSWFYNSCVKYLLERVSDFGMKWCIEKFQGPRHAEIMLASHPFVSISSLTAYLEKEIGNIRMGNSVHSVRQLKWEVLNLGKFSASTPEESSGLQMADVVTSAFYSFVEQAGGAKKVSALPATALTRALWDGSILNNRRYGFANNGVTVWPPYRPLMLEPELMDFFGGFGHDLRRTPYSRR